MELEQFQTKILEGIPSVLPEAKVYEDKINHAPKRKAILNADEKKLAIQNAKAKAEDFVSVLNQKVGKAMTISDNSQAYYPPRPMYEMKAQMMSDAGAAPRETLATGEMEIIINVSIGFLLE